MANFKERYSKLTGLWTVSSVSTSQYSTKRLAKDIERESTVSYADIMAVLSSLPSVMQRYMAEGHTVKLEGIGTFFLTVQCHKTGVANKEDCSAEQITNVKVQFRPEVEPAGRKGKRKNTLVADNLEWVYLPTPDKKPSEADDEEPPSGDEPDNPGSGNGGTTPGGGDNGGGDNGDGDLGE